jgi:branched-chain amino acid transport system substrate-binding protein
MKRLVFGTVVLLLVMFVAGCAKQAQGTIKIGYGGGLTGSAAQEGNDVRRGALMAIEEANKAGGYKGRMFEQMALDDQHDPKESTMVATRFVGDSSVIAVIGHQGSSCTLAAAPIYNKAGLVDIACGSSSPKLTDAGPYTFRVWNSDSYTSRFNVQKIIDLGYKRIAFIYENNDFGVGGYDVAKKVLEDAGMKPVAAESYLLGETKDFTAIITKLKAAGTDAVYALSDETEIPLFLKQAHQANFNPFFVSAGIYNLAVIRLGGQDVEGAVGNALFNPDNLSPSLKAFFDKYLERFKSENVTGVVPQNVAAYDATRMIIDAVKKGGASREAVKNYLTTLKDFEGVLGKLSFDANGDMVIPMVYMTIKDGKFTEFKK